MTWKSLRDQLRTTNPSGQVRLILEHCRNFKFEHGQKVLTYTDAPPCVKVTISFDTTEEMANELAALDAAPQWVEADNFRNGMPRFPQSELTRFIFSLTQAVIDEERKYHYMKSIESQLEGAQWTVACLSSDLERAKVRAQRPYRQPRRVAR